MSRCESREGKESGKEEQLEQRVGQELSPWRDQVPVWLELEVGVGRRGRERRLQVEAGISGVMQSHWRA